MNTKQRIHHQLAQERGRLLLVEGADGLHSAHFFIVERQVHAPGADVGRVGVHVEVSLGGAGSGGGLVGLFLWGGDQLGPDGAPVGGAQVFAGVVEFDSDGPAYAVGDAVLGGRLVALDARGDRLATERELMDALEAYLSDGSVPGADWVREKAEAAIALATQ